MTKGKDMQENIKKILEEIYMIDDEMKSHEADLGKIIQKLIEEKPDIQIDQVFIKSLREKIMANLDNKTEEIVEPKVSFFTIKNFAFSGAGALIMLLIMLPAISDKQFESVTETNISSSKVADIGARAFGLLTTGSGEKNLVNNVQDEAVEGQAQSFAADEATEITFSDSAISQSIAEPMVGAGGGMTKMIEPFYNQSYQYKYVGGEIENLEKNAKVFKRTSGDDFSSLLASNLGNMQFELFDISKMKNAEIQNLNISEDRDFGLNLNINASEGTININKNWQTWQSPDMNCKYEECLKENRLSIDDVPSDDKVFALADKFLSDYGIDMASYGKAELQDAWRDNYLMTKDRGNYYIPEELQVIYPLMIDGQILYDQGGRSSGLTVNVDIRHMKVAGVYTIITNNFESSNYELETNQKKIIELVENNYLSGPMFYDEDEKNTKEIMPLIVELGSPSQILLRHWHYNQAEQKSEELFIPALMFPVNNVDEGIRYFNQKYIIIPLVKDILDSYKENIDIPRPDIMPLMRSGSNMMNSAILNDEPMDAIEVDVIEMGE